MKNEIIDFIISNEKEEVYIQKRSKDSNSYPNTWELPGGKVEKGEDHAECIKRELKEELNLELESVYDLIFESDLSLEKGDFKYFVYYIKINNWNNFKLEKDKATEFKWINKNELEILNIKRHDNKVSPLYLAVLKFFKEDVIKKERISYHFKQIMKCLNIKETESTIKTPKRVAKMFCEEIFYGLCEEKFPEITLYNIDKDLNYDEIIEINNIEVNSFCEHHFLPFCGTAKIRYIPNKKIIGLSKINRIVDFYCRKPQLQEKLTIEIFNKLKEILDTNKLSVEIEAQHFCIKFRGIKQNSVVKTSKNEL